MATTVVLTNAGRAILTNRIKGSGTEPNFVAWGTGSHTAAAADTALTTESSETRATGTSTRTTTSVTNDTYQVVGTITATGTRAIIEGGLFDAVTVGNMFISATFDVINLLVGDAIQFTYTLQFT